MKIDANIRVSYPQNSNNDAVVNLLIEDAASGELLFDARISAEVWVQMQSALGVIVSGETSPRLDRVGKKMITQSRGFDHTEDESSINTEEYILRNDGFTDFEVQRTNYGRRLVGRKWVDA